MTGAAVAQFVSMIDASMASRPAATLAETDVFDRKLVLHRLAAVIADPRDVCSVQMARVWRRDHRIIRQAVGGIRQSMKQSSPGSPDKAARCNIAPPLAAIRRAGHHALPVRP